MAGELVLVVDDNAKNLRLARDVLQAGGFRTLWAATGSEGVAMAVDGQPDVILMDIRLPDIDGTEVARRLKTDVRTASIPVVALTSLAMKGDRERFLESGFDGYLEKPIDVRAFPEQVRAYCRGRSAVQREGGGGATNSAVTGRSGSATTGDRASGPPTSARGIPPGE